MFGRLFGRRPKASAEGEGAYTVALTQRARDAALNGVSLARHEAAVEAAVGLVERSMMAVRWTPDWWDGRMSALTARRLLLRGNAFFLPTPRAGGYAPVPAREVEITGQEAQPSAWTYHLTVASPGGARQVIRRGARVWHFRTGMDVETPWLGESPLQKARSTKLLLAKVHRSMGEEMDIPSARLLGVAGQGFDQDQKAEIQQYFRNSAGQLILLDSPRHSPDMAPMHSETTPGAVKAQPAETALQLRTALLRETIESLGVPADLIMPPTAPTGPGTVQLHRKFLSGAVLPLLEVMRLELESKTGVEMEYDTSRLRLADLAALARAVHVLTASGMSVDDALRQVGWQEE